MLGPSYPLNCGVPFAELVVCGGWDTTGAGAAIASCEVPDTYFLPSTTVMMVGSV